MDGRAVGFVGTAVRHHELGQIALALVKQNVPADAQLRVGESDARRSMPSSVREPMTTTLITVAPTGAEVAKGDAPALPVTLDELVAAAKECEALGEDNT